MSTVLSDISSDGPPAVWTIADVRALLPGFPVDRIRIVPTPGTATEKDLLKTEARDERICELIDGTLVEKTMSSFESSLAAELIYFIRCYLELYNIGLITGEAGLLKILPKQIRAPDVAFIPWDRLPKRGESKPTIYAVVVLDLAAEILSKGNTKKEMDRNLKDYFKVGVRLVWYIDSKTRTARYYTAVRTWIDIGRDVRFSEAKSCPASNYRWRSCSRGLTGRMGLANQKKYRGTERTELMFLLSSVLSAPLCLVHA